MRWVLILSLSVNCLSAQNVGIGQPVPIGKLHISVPGNYTDLAFIVDTSGTPVLVVTPQANVGINTPAPAVSLHVSGLANVDTQLVNVTIQDDFDPDVDWSVWQEINGGITDAGCSSISGNALRFNGAQPRQATTKPFLVCGAASVSFAIQMGSAADAAPCENPEVGEEVVLEYSIDGGLTWIQLATYGPTLFPMTTFTVNLPASLTGQWVMLRWRQVGGSSSPDWDHWAIDNVTITGVCRYDIPAQSGDVYIEQVGRGVILKSPDGRCWRLTVNESGELQTQLLSACP